jgi:hypothetical protein
MKLSLRNPSSGTRSQAWQAVVLLAPMLLLAAIASGQSIAFNSGGIVSITATPPVYNDKYVMQKTDFGFFWLDTVALQAGLVQVEAKCGTGQPSPVTNIWVRGDCNGITNIDTAGDIVLARQRSGQCGVATLGCGGRRGRHRPFAPAGNAVPRSGSRDINTLDPNARPAGRAEGRGRRDGKNFT